MNKIAKGARTLKKTKDYFIAQGYSVESIEKNQTVFTKAKDGTAKYFFLKKDLWGGDLICAHKEKNELLWLQVKTNKTDVSKGKKELETNPLPKFVKKAVIWWLPRKKEPEILWVE